MGANLFHADERTNTTKLTITFRNFANAPKMGVTLLSRKSSDENLEVLICSHSIYIHPALPLIHSYNLQVLGDNLNISATELTIGDSSG